MALPTPVKAQSITPAGQTTALFRSGGVPAGSSARREDHTNRRPETQRLGARDRIARPPRSACTLSRRAALAVPSATGHCRYCSNSHLFCRRCTTENLMIWRTTWPTHCRGIFPLSTVARQVYSCLSKTSHNSSKRPTYCPRICHNSVADAKRRSVPEAVIVASEPRTVASLNRSSSLKVQSPRKRHSATTRLEPSTTTTATTQMRLFTNLHFKTMLNYCRPILIADFASPIILTTTEERPFTAQPKLARFHVPMSCSTTESIRMPRINTVTRRSTPPVPSISLIWLDFCTTGKANLAALSKIAALVRICPSNFLSLSVVAAPRLSKQERNKKSWTKKSKKRKKEIESCENLICVMNFKRQEKILAARTLTDVRIGNIVASSGSDKLNSDGMRKQVSSSQRRKRKRAHRWREMS